MDNIEQFLAACKFASTTKESYRRVLNRLGETVHDAERLTAAELAQWLERQRTWGPSMRWMAMCCIKSYVRWRYGDRHPALEMQMKREESPPQRVLREHQVEKLLASFDTRTAVGRRNLAICTLMLDSGLRAAELCRLDIRYLDLEERSFQVIVKGGDWAGGSFSTYTRSCLMGWLGDREKLAKPGVKSVFVAVGGLHPGTQMTSDGLTSVVRKWGKKAGMKLSPHDLRRTFATIATRLGASPRVVQAAGRWKSLAMVQHYTRSIEAKDMDRWFPVDGVMNGDY